MLASVQEGWDDFELEPHVHSQVMHMIAFNVQSTKFKNTGLLKNAKIGGALVYAPPGTGKPHLSRIIAKASSAAMIHVSTADITNKRVEHISQGAQKLR